MANWNAVALRLPIASQKLAAMLISDGLGRMDGLKFDADMVSELTTSIVYTNRDTGEAYRISLKVEVDLEIKDEDED